LPSFKITEGVTQTNVRNADSGPFCYSCFRFNLMSASWESRHSCFCSRIRWLRDFCGSKSCIVMHSTAFMSVDASWLIVKNNQLTPNIWIREAGAGGSNPLTPTNFSLARLILYNAPCLATVFCGVELWGVCRDFSHSFVPVTRRTMTGCLWPGGPAFPPLRSAQIRLIRALEEPFRPLNVIFDTN
jgi:hypothetical protein